MKTTTAIEFGNQPLTPPQVSEYLGEINKREHMQAVAATAAGDYLGIATFDGNIVDAFIQCSVVVGAGESMTVDILKNGVSVLTGVVTVPAGTPAKSQIDIFKNINRALVAFVKGDVFTTSRVYTPGGTPTPMARTHVELHLSPGALYK